MALPRIDAPTYELELPVSKKKIKYRPFLVKEQKILLMAMESGESDVIETNIRQILQNCAVTEIDIDALPLIDIEYYFLNLRAKSVGEIVETKYKCENVVNEKVCGNMMETEFNITDVKVQMPVDLNDLIKITDKVGIKLKYPDYSVVNRIRKSESVTDIAFELILECIEYIYDEDNLYYAKESTKEELMTFLESLTKEQFGRIEEYIDNLPKLEKTIEMTCNKCGYDHKIKVQGLDDFFG